MEYEAQPQPQQPPLTESDLPQVASTDVELGLKRSCDFERDEASGYSKRRRTDVVSRLDALRPGLQYNFCKAGTPTAPLFTIEVEVDGVQHKYTGGPSRKACKKGLAKKILDLIPDSWNQFAALQDKRAYSTDQNLATPGETGGAQSGAELAVPAVQRKPKALKPLLQYDVIGYEGPPSALLLIVEVSKEIKTENQLVEVRLEVKTDETARDTLGAGRESTDIDEVEGGSESTGSGAQQRALSSEEREVFEARKSCARNPEVDRAGLSGETLKADGTANEASLEPCVSVDVEPRISVVLVTGVGPQAGPSDDPLWRKEVLRIPAEDLLRASNFPSELFPRSHHVILQHKGHNPVSLLYEKWVGAQYYDIPLSYDTVRTGIDHHQCDLYIEGRRFSGTGLGKRHAKMAAAIDALTCLFGGAGRPLLLFDLNGTLTSHTTTKGEDGYIHHHVLRPNVEHLWRLREKFQLGIFSSASWRTVRGALDFVHQAVLSSSFYSKEQAAEDVAAEDVAAEDVAAESHAAPCTSSCAVPEPLHEDTPMSEAAVSEAPPTEGREWSGEDAGTWCEAEHVDLFSIILSRDHCTAAPETHQGDAWDTVKPLHWDEGDDAEDDVIPRLVDALLQAVPSDGDRCDLRHYVATLCAAVPVHQPPTTMEGTQAASASTTTVSEEEAQSADRAATKGAEAAQYSLPCTEDAEMPHEKGSLPVHLSQVRFFMAA
eukprot:gene6320-7573_t